MSATLDRTFVATLETSALGSAGVIVATFFAAVVPGNIAQWTDGHEERWRRSL